MSSSRAYDEIVDFIARGSGPSAVSSFQPSKQTKERIAALIGKEKLENLTAEERAELDHYMHIEHIMRLAKARAKQILSAA
jgi:predicted phage-related endonuclease